MKKPHSDRLNSGKTHPLLLSALSGSVVAAAMLAAFAAHTSVESWAVQLGAALAIVVAALTALWLRPSGSVELLAPLIASGVGVLWLLLRSAFAANPSTSLLGMFGTGTGAVMWAVAWAGFAVAALASSPRAALRTVRHVLAAGGALAAAAALLDAAGVIPHPGLWSGEPSGLLGTSNALGQLLILALGACVSLAIDARTRLYGIVLAVLVTAGLVASNSRSAMVAVAICGAAALVVVRTKTRRRVAAVGALGLLVVPVLALLLVSLLGQPLAEVDQLLTGRSTLWHETAAQVSQAPMVGSGSQMFTVVYEWSEDLQRVFGVNVSTTYSPHSLALDWLLAGGLLGVAALTTAVVFYVRALAPTCLRARQNDPVWPLVAALLAWFVAALVSVVESAPLVAAAVAGGALLAVATSEGPPASKRIRLAMTVTAGAVGVAVAVALQAPLSTGVAALKWDSSNAGPDNVDTYRTAYEHTGDPTYPTLGLRMLLSLTGQPYPDSVALDARSLASLARADAYWHVDAAELGAAAETLRSTEPTSTQYERIASFLSAGEAADPASSIWEWLAEREAQRLGVTR